MGNFLLAHASHTNRIMDAYSATHETAAGPVSNLFTPQPKECWITQNVTGAMTLRFDLGTPTNYSYDFLALLFTNGSDAGTITWTGSSSSTFSSTAWTSGSIPLIKAGQGTVQRRHHFYLPGTQTARYLQLAVSDSSNPDGVFQAGRFYVESAYRPTINVRYPLGFGFERTGSETVTPYGERIVRVTEKTPRLNFVVQAIGTNAEDEFYDNVHEIMRDSHDVVGIINPEHSTRAGAMLHYGTLQPVTMIELQNFQTWEAGFEITGLI